MGNFEDELSELIKTDRQARRGGLWKGVFLEYLQKLRQNPDLSKQAHTRLYDIVIGDGWKDQQSDNDPAIKRLFGDQSLKIYNFFKDEFFGIELPVAQLVRYLHAAALKGEEYRQVLYLLGPVGAGKSSLVEALRSGLERAEPFHAIDGCPMHEEPLHVIPHHLRREFERMLDVTIEGDLCPVCQFRLEEEFGNRYEEMPVKTVSYSKQARRGLAIVPPVDPNNQDTSVLIGSEDISKLDRYSEGDPRVLELNGAFNVGNRGMIEFIEVFKNEIEYLHTIITATQEKFVPAPGRHGTVYVDTVIVAHSNEAEWQKFKADPTNEAILDRIVTIKVPYNLRLSEEVKIYNKLLEASGFRSHVAPHTLEVLAMFAILTRLGPSETCDLMTKLKLYNGEEVVEKGGTKRIDIDELRAEIKSEGMTGVSPRFAMKALDNALTESPEGITPIQLREALIDMVREADFPEKVHNQYLEFLQDMIHKAYLEILEREITKAFVYAYEEQAETLFQNYLDHAEAYVNKTTVKDRDTREELRPDEAFLKSIEEQIAIIGPQADGFRQEVIGYLWAAGRRGEKIVYKSYEPLKEAVEKKLIKSVREISRIITKARTRDEEQREKYEALVNNLLEQGYTDYSAEVVLKYAANNLWKD
jgi:serine protein kinase